MSWNRRNNKSNSSQEAVAYKKIMDNSPITIQELLQLKDECLTKISDEEIYRLRNDAKIRAVYSTKSYDEFKDIVDAAHLKPINKKDKMDASTKSRLWNTTAKD